MARREENLHERGDHPDRDSAREGETHHERRREEEVPSIRPQVLEKAERSAPLLGPAPGHVGYSSSERLRKPIRSSQSKSRTKASSKS
jgi:hypothetical protein